MTNRNGKFPRVLAIAPCVQGIGFAVFNGPKLPIDWGVKWTRGDKNALGLAKVRALIRSYEPDVLVFEDCRSKDARRARRIVALLDVIADEAERGNLATVRYSRAQVRRHFAGDQPVTKYQIAEIIAAEIPDFTSRLPAPRKIWLPEHANMSLFAAAALALTHYAIGVPRDDQGTASARAA
jgi:Holliday junction resolvasome RuvABC endonuclease subunit